MTGGWESCRGNKYCNMGLANLSPGPFPSAVGKLAFAQGSGGNLQGCTEVMNIDTLIPVVAVVMIHPRPKPRACNPSDVSV